MRNFLSRLFYWKNPAPGMVFSLALLIFGSWSIWSVLVLCSSLTQILPGQTFWCMKSNGEIFASLAAPFGLPLLFLIYFLIQLIHNFRIYRQRIFGQWKWGLLLVLFVFLWGWGIDCLISALRAWDTIFSHYGDTEFYCETPPAWLIYLAPAASFGILFAAGMLAAGMAQIRRREIFGRGTAAVLGLTASVYLISAILAVYAARETETSVAETEEFFHASLTADALKTAYYHNRKIDDGFWKKVRDLQMAVEKDISPVQTRELVGEYKNFSAEKLQDLERALDKSGNLAEWERMFSAPLPSPERDHAVELLAAMNYPEMSPCLDFCRLELIRLRFALACKDRKTALAAVRRMDQVCRLLAAGNALLPGLVMNGVEEMCLTGLDELLGSGLMTESDLREEKALIGQRLAALPKIHRQCIYAEAVMSMDLCNQLSHGFCAEEWNGKKTNKHFPGMYPFRWIMPAAWYVMTRSRRVLVRAYRVDDFTRIRKLHLRDIHTDQNWFPRLLLASLPRAGERFHETEMRQKILMTLIDLEIHRLKTGSFPEKFELPDDWFSGEKCLYSKDRKTGTLLIWSVGRNRRNDGGKTSQKYDGPDDIALGILRK